MRVPPSYPKLRGSPEGRCFGALVERDHLDACCSKTRSAICKSCCDAVLWRRTAGISSHLGFPKSTLQHRQRLELHPQTRFPDAVTSFYTHLPQHDPVLTISALLELLVFPVLVVPPSLLLQVPPSTLSNNGVVQAMAQSATTLLSIWPQAWFLGINLKIWAKSSRMFKGIPASNHKFLWHVHDETTCNNLPKMTLKASLHHYVGNCWVVVTK